MNMVSSEYYGLDPFNGYKQALDCSCFLSFQYNNLRFTRRETQCLACFILGMTAKQIAKVLSISPRTAEDYISFIKSKFNCNDRYKIVTEALLGGFPIDDFLQNCAHKEF